MGRKVDVDDLVGASEIAERLGKRHAQYIHYWVANDPQFPQAVAAIGRGRKTLVWVWADIERWAIQSGRIPPDSTVDGDHR